MSKKSKSNYEKYQSRNIANDETTKANDAVTKKATIKKTSAANKIKVGSIIQIKQGSTNYNGVTFGNKTFVNKYTVGAINGDKVTFISRKGYENQVNLSNCILISQFETGMSFKIVSCSGTTEFSSTTFSNTYTIESISDSTVTFLSNNETQNTINVKYCYVV